MTAFRNNFANGRFARTQPRQWRNQPFAGDLKIWPLVLKGLGVALLWAALFGLSLWSIAEQVK